MSTYTADEIWPVSTQIVPNGGIGVDWSAPGVGWGRFELYWGEDNKLHCDTECMESVLDPKRDFIRTMLNLIAEEVIVDG